MTFLESMIASPLVAASGVVVLHFLWQGALIGLLGRVVLHAARNRSPQLRYAICCTALWFALDAFVMTFVIVVRSIEPSGALAIGAGTAAPGGTGVHLNVVAWMWLLGTMIMAARMVGQWRSALRLKRDGVCAVDCHWSAIFEALCRDLGAPRATRVLRSTLADVPMVIGWLAPVVLVPASAFTSLTPDQLRAVLAHEIAHIRRHDYLINTLQKVVEAVLFFHPAVWWLSNRIRLEREHCCDDVAVRTAGNPMIYARALSSLEAMRTDHTPLAVAANGGSLMLRIKRIVGVETTQARTRTGWLTAGTLAAGVALATSGVTYAAALNGNGESTIRDNKSQVTDKAVLREVEATLQKAIESGALTAEEARRFYSVFRGVDGKVKPIEWTLPQLGWDQRGELADLADKLEEMVAEGELTIEQARAKLDKAKGHMAGRAKAEAYLKDVQAQLDAAVEMGSLSAAEARAKLDAVHQTVAARLSRGMGSEKGNAKDIDRKLEAHLQSVAERLDRAVAAGELTADEARLKMAEVKQQLADRARVARDMHMREKAHLDLLAQKLEAAVAAGEITVEQARTELKQIKADLAARLEQDRIHSEASVMIDRAALKLHEAAQRGEITKEEVRARLDEYRAEIADRIDAHLKENADNRAHLEEVVAVIQEAVEAGKLTPEEGQAKLDAIRAELMKDRR